MKKKSEMALTLAGIIFCLCLPVLAAWTGQRLTDGRQWSVTNAAAYHFAGTLENRVNALNAYGNASPHIVRGSAEAETADETLWKRLSDAGLIPEAGGSLKASAERFRLSPARYDAGYEYVETRLRDGSQALSVTQDVVSGMILRVELTGAQAALRSWTGARYGEEMLKNYLEFLGYGRESESFGSYGDNGLAVVERTLIPQTYLEAAVTVSRPAGVMIYQLSLAGNG